MIKFSFSVILISLIIITGCTNCIPKQTETDPLLSETPKVSENKLESKKVDGLEQNNTKTTPVVEKQKQQSISSSEEDTSKTITQNKQIKTKNKTQTKKEKKPKLVILKAKDTNSKNYWTPEKMKNAQPVQMIKEYDTLDVYGASWCGPCHHLKAYLAKQKISYTYHDVDQNSENKKYRKHAPNAGGIPTSIINQNSPSRKKIIVGFSNLLKTQLQKHKFKPKK